MGHFFDFGNIKNNERTIRKTWDEFRDALAMENFSYDDIEKAKKCTFLKVYNDLFYDNFGIKHSTLKLNVLDGTLVGRGCVLKKTRCLNMKDLYRRKNLLKMIIDSVLRE